MTDGGIVEIHTAPFFLPGITLREKTTNLYDQNGNVSRSRGTCFRVEFWCVVP